MAVEQPTADDSCCQPSLCAEGQAVAQCSCLALPVTAVGLKASYTRASASNGSSSSSHYFCARLGGAPAAAD